MSVAACELIGHCYCIRGIRNGKEVVACCECGDGDEEEGEVMAAIDYLAAIELDDDGHVFRQMTALAVKCDADNVMQHVEALAEQADALGMTDYHIILSRSDSYGDEKHEDGKDVYRAHSTVNVLYTKKRGGPR